MIVNDSDLPPNDLGAPSGTTVDASSLPEQPQPRVFREEVVPDPMRDMPTAPSYSVNDFAKWREQDQTVAQLASQLADMEGPLWTVHQLEPAQKQAPESSQYWIGNYYDQRKSPVMNLANQLNKLSAPPARFLTSKDFGAGGTICGVTVGNRKIVAEDKPAGVKIMDRINGDVIALTAPIRKRILSDLHDYATTGVLSLVAANRLWIAECSINTVLFFSTEAEAQEYADKLNDSYKAAMANSYSLVLKEMAEATDPSVGATMGHTLTENDRQLPDFRKVSAGA